MSETKSGGDGVARRIDAMEEAYEFMLAYAARGVMVEEEVEGEGIRAFLFRMAEALDDLAGAAVVEAGHLPPALAEACQPFVAVLAADAAKALAAVRLVLAFPSIGSQLVDNLNASIHVRAVLADLFLLDETLKIEC